jgi:protoporphyrinogen oxidase
MGKLSKAQLVESFRKHGAKDPESWAESEVEEGINQLARFSLLKALTSELLKESDLEWVDEVANRSAEPGVPLSQLGPAVKQMLDKGVSKEAIIDLVRVIQYNSLAHVASVLDDSSSFDTPVNNWAVFECDEDDAPIEAISSLHESLLEFDPSDREFMPRS